MDVSFTAASSHTLDWVTYRFFPFDLAAPTGRFQPTRDIPGALSYDYFRPHQVHDLLDTGQSDSSGRGRSTLHEAPTATGMVSIVGERWLVATTPLDRPTACPHFLHFFANFWRRSPRAKRENSFIFKERGFAGPEFYAGCFSAPLREAAAQMVSEWKA